MATAEPARDTAPPATTQTRPSERARPQRADVELLGRIEGSGFKDPPFLVRRPDGQVIQLPHPLYAIVELADGTRSLTQLADDVSDAIRARIDPDGVRMLIDEKLAPLGLFDAGDGSAPLERADPLLGLRFKKGVVPASVVRALTTAFRPLFFGPVVVVALAALVAFDVWLFGVHGVAQSVRHAVYQPGLLVVLFALIVVAAAFHEVGHATACSYGGAEPGEMGVGLYVVWPAFYTDVTDSYRLGRGGRLRTDLGGVYFNALFILMIAGLYAATHLEFLLLVVLVQHFAILQQLLPLLRLDGYYIVADLTGVPDMFGRIKPILLSFVPGRETDERVRELTWWARAIVTVWVLTIVPLMIYVLGAVVVHLPRIMGTVWDSWGRLSGQAGEAFGRGDALGGIAAILQMAVLALPAAAATLTTARLARRTAVRGWRATEGEPLARTAAIAAAAAVVALIVFLWWPNDDYRPIGPTERWTVQDSVAAFARVPAGDPGLTPADRAPIEATDTTADRGGFGTTVEPVGATDPSGGGAPTSGAGTDEHTGQEQEPAAEPSTEPSPEGEPSPSPSAEPSPEPSGTSPSPTTSPASGDVGG